MALNIEIPAKQVGPKVRQSKEEVERDAQMCSDAVGTMHQWGRAAVIRLKQDAERLGVTIKFTEAK